MSVSTPYLLNVALHVAILSVIACLALIFLKQARHRSVIAMAGAVGVRTPLVVSMARRGRTGLLKRRIVSLLDATADSARPVGKSFIGIGCFVFTASAILMSSVRIDAEEAVRKKEPPLASTQTQPLGVSVETTMVFSKKALGPKDGEVLKQGEVAKLLAKAKTEGCFTVEQNWSQALGEIHSSELIQEISPGLVSGTSSQWRRPRPNDPPGNGIRFEAVVTREGELTNTVVRSVYRYVPGSAYPVALNAAKPYDEGTEFNFKRATASAGLKFGEALSMDFGEVDPGVFLQAFTTAVPLAPGGFGTSFRTKTRMPSAEVKGRVRVSGVKIRAQADDVKSALEKYPAGSVFRKDDDDLTWGLPQVLECWKYILGSEVQELAPVEFTLNEFHAPWSKVPGFEISIIASDDHEYFGITGKPARDAVDQEERKVPLFNSELLLTFKLRNEDPKMASRVFIKIEMVR